MTAALMAAISAFYVAGDEAQRAIDADMCGHGTGPVLSSEAARQYRHVLVALDAAGIADAAVRRVFCEWAGER